MRRTAVADTRHRIDWCMKKESKRIIDGRRANKMREMKLITFLFEMNYHEIIYCTNVRWPDNISLKTFINKIDSRSA